MNEFLHWFNAEMWKVSCINEKGILPLSNMIFSALSLHRLQLWFLCNIMGSLNSYFCFTFQRLNPLSLKRNAEITFTMFSENWTLYFRQCPKTGYEEENIVVVSPLCCISNDWFFGMMAVVEDSQWLFHVKVSYRDVHHRNDSRSHFIVISKVSWRWLRPSRVGFGLGIVMISMITKYP